MMMESAFVRSSAIIKVDSVRIRGLLVAGAGPHHVADGPKPHTERLGYSGGAWAAAKPALLRARVVPAHSTQHC